MPSLAIPWRAYVFGLPLILGAMVIGGAAGGWVIPVWIAVTLRHDWAGLAQVPRTFGIVPTMPQWYTHAEKILWNMGAIPSLSGAALGLFVGQKLWRHLVVRRYKWMTDEEVNDFLRRGGDDSRLWFKGRRSGSRKR